MTPPVPPQVVVGLDVGTTGVKAVAFGMGSPWRRMAIREYPLLQPALGWAVQDPDTVVAAAAAALAECVAATGDAEVVAVSVSTAMHGLIALDADLRPLTPLVTWADARAHNEARALRHSSVGAELHALTGAPVHPMTPLTKVMWFARHDRAIWAAARWWVGLKDYVLVWLTGRLVTELSSASGTGLLDMSTRAWHPAAVELCGVSVDRLPEIVATTAILSLAPATARQVDLPVGTPVVVGAADGPLGNLGTGAMTPGVAGLSLGTSGAVRMAVGTPYVDPGRTLFCYALTDSVWVVGGAISNGGVVVRWAGHALAPDVHGTGGAGADEAVLQLAAAVPGGSDGLVMVPYLLAERAPLWDPDLPGAYLGLRQEHTRAHLIRAAVEGVCLQMRILLDRLDEAEPVSSVRVTGGVFRSPLWRQVMAAMLDRPLSVVGDAEGTALGAAALGLFALGRAAHLTDAVALLSDADVPPPLVDADPELVATYDGLRASVFGLVRDLDRVAELFR
ncbi:MAG TPA: gluconokinase [Mycobacteriales bacterium]|nr:gluconokinase [Mycobacteriales bacterium]